MFLSSNQPKPDTPYQTTEDKKWFRRLILVHCRNFLIYREGVWVYESGIDIFS